VMVLGLVLGLVLDTHLFTNRMTFGLLVFLILGVRLSDSYLFRSIRSPTFGLLVTQIRSPNVGLLIFLILGVRLSDS